MHQETDLILTIAGALTAALVLGLTARKLRLSPIVGYLAAGVVVGPFTPGFVAHPEIARQLADVGVVLLMFGVGLSLHVRELLAVGRVVVPGAVLATAAGACAGFLVTRAFGWSAGAGLVYGLAIGVASTVVLVRVLGDAELSHAPAGHLALGWLIVEDLLVVLVLVVAPILGGARAASLGALALALALAAGKIAALVVVTLVVGKRLMPWVLAFVARTRSRELFTLTILVMALGVGVGAGKLFGASMALGAFLAGLVVGQSDFAARAASDALPMRDAFAVLFFVATGMQLDPARLAAHLPLVLATVAVVWTVKPAVAALVIVVARRPAKTAVLLAAGLAQIGEFSFVLAALGRQLGVLPDAAVQSLVATSIVTITASPLLVRLAERWAPSLDRRGRRPPAAGASPAADAAYRAVVVGYGPIGASLVRLLAESGIEATVVDMNHETVARLRARKIAAVHGDAARPEILELAGARSAGSFFFTASGPADGAVRAARELNPHMLILTRAPYLRDVGALQRAGASDVVSAEGEVALAFAERLLEHLGASAEQLDRARARVRHEVQTAATIVAPARG